MEKEKKAGGNKVIHFFLYLKTLKSTSIYLFLHPFWDFVGMCYVQVGEKRTEFHRTISHYSTLFFNCIGKKCSNLIFRSF